jgi:hypothetical protein
MNLPLLALAFITCWVALLNSVFLYPKFTLIKYVYVEWAWRMVALLGLGIWLDELTKNKPHAAYEQWEFYASFMIASAVISLPGYFLSKR